ncbi:hypothetical protein ACLKA6_017757 [Drosophila palustris]
MPGSSRVVVLLDSLGSDRDPSLESWPLRLLPERVRRSPQHFIQTTPLGRAVNCENRHSNREFWQNIVASAGTANSTAIERASGAY